MADRAGPVTRSWCGTGRPSRRTVSSTTACAGGGDRRPHRRALVGRQVVHDHDIARLQRRAQDLLDVGQEPPPGHRPIQHHRCCEAAQAQTGDEGGGLPVPMQDAGAQPLAAGATPVQAGHFGRGAGLVEEHQLGRIKVGLRLKPRLPCRGDVRAVLLGRMRGFLYVMPRAAKKRHSVPMLADAPRSSRRRACNSAKVRWGVTVTRPSKNAA